MKKSFTRSEAFILNTVDFGESDRMVSLYTLAHGKLSGVCKGARRTKKRFVGKLDVPTMVRVLYHGPSSGGVFRIDEAELLEGYAPIKADVGSYASACYMLELAAELTREGIVNTELFRLMESFLIELLRLSMEGEEASANGNDKKASLLRFYEIKILSLLGYLPFLEGCVLCKVSVEAGDGTEFFFASDRGGVVCKGCAGGGFTAVPIRVASARLLSMAVKLPIDKLKRLQVGGGFIRESGDFLSDFIKHQIGKELKSRVFLQKLKAAEVTFGRMQLRGGDARRSTPAAYK